MITRLNSLFHSFMAWLLGNNNLNGEKAVIYVRLDGKKRHHR